ncbi:hypothetical protein [Bradyrhizobium sp.]|uniref:hypothetical protein n=1 Tax=Bradyrhizobium sp. TaxID=376 RepID=UPI0025BB01FA|nr:hypothetical protein [Bradyrhizobium sp.]
MLFDAVFPWAGAEAVTAAPGLDGGRPDEVAGATGDPVLKARYEAQEVKRKKAQAQGTSTKT